jgi:preprotein translocase subunit SecF
LFQILQDTHFDFLGKRRLWVGISAVAIALSLLSLAVRGINYGIEFTGGSEVQLQFADRPDVGSIRSSLAAAGFSGAVVTTIGDPGDHEVYIRVPLRSEDDREDVTSALVEALRSDDSRQKEASGLLDLNAANASELSAFLLTVEGTTAESAEATARAIVDARAEGALFRSAGELSAVPGVTDAAVRALEARAFAGPFAVRSQSYIGPIIGKELVRKAIWAILGSLGGILVYLWVRFEFQWGLAAVIALVHDTIVTLGLFSALQFEMSLPVVASFLTLIGYSVNDTVVIFDRVRENLRTRSGPTDYAALLNQSVNQTLSRTIITSLLTWFVCLALFFFGGEILRAFSFVLVVGVVVGSYSTIYVASPVLLWWRQWVASRGKAKEEATVVAAPARRVAKKVRPQEKA